VVTPEIVSTRTHDSSCYTQGLLLHDGSLYESCGGYGGNSYGPSTLRQVNPENGQVIRSVTLDGQYFAEGLALVGTRLIQLTWQEHVALVWDITTFTEVDQFSYTGDGWGLCYDGTRLVMSDGSNRLTFRDPTDFHEIGHVDVTLEYPAGTVNSLSSLNELECVGASVYANIYTGQERWIVEIDAATGVVTRWIQAPALHPEWIGDWDHVLNGIAHDPATGNFLITGKLWPDLFEARFGAASSTDGAPTDDGAAPGDPPPATGDSATSPGDPKPPADGRASSKGCSAVVPWPALLALVGRPRSRR
jgi:glutaminyl-peptide cyclotransferase